jgi:hypothetical protein
MSFPFPRPFPGPSMVSFNVLSLFSSGEQGAWYDPSDFSTMFQDSAGSTPVTAVEQPVGLIRDKSGRGNHASQATSTSRPVLSARYNLILNSGYIGGVAGTPGTAPTNWTFVLSGGTTNAFVSDDAGGFITSFTASAARQIVNQSVSVGVATYSAFVTINTNTGPFNLNNLFTLSAVPAGTTTTFYANGSLINEATYPPAAGDRIEARSVVTTAGTITYRVGAGASSNVTGTVAFSKFDIRVTNDGVGIPAYQRINAATDYDTNGFPLYLAFDGVDDSLSTASVDFSATNKMSVFAGVRKLSDAARAILCELGTGAVATNAFNLEAPSAASDTFRWRSGGSVAQEVVPTGFAAPTTRVLTGTADIPGDDVTLRANGAQVATLSADQGTGNYSNDVLYVGRRAGTSLPFSGRVYSLIVRGATTNADQIARTEAWVNNITKAY